MEQFFFSDYEKPNTPKKKINDLLEKISKFSEFDIKAFEASENKQKEKLIGYSITVDNVLAAKTNVNFTKICADRKIINLLKLPESTTVKEIKNPCGFVRAQFETAEDGEKVLENILKKFTETYIPAERFGCCHRYKECSDARHCIAPDKLHARGCYYRENLENGKIFYGKNANI